MAGDFLTAPGLLAHVFMEPGGPGATAAPRALGSLWDAVTRGLGLDRAIPSLHVPSYPPRDLASSAAAFRLLAAAESDARSVWQACAWADHGILGVTVMMAPPRDQDCASAWAGLERTWEEALTAV